MEKQYIIYKLECLTDISGSLVYVGSTSNFRTRKCYHKKACNNEKNKNYNSQIYKKIRENGGIENWQMIPIEELPNTTKLQARIREQFWIDHYKITANTLKAYRSEEEKKNQLKEGNKKYREKNKEKFKVYQNEWAKNNREKVSEKKRRNYLKKKAEKNEIIIQTND